MTGSPRLVVPTNLAEAVDAAAREGDGGLLVAGATAVSVMLHHRLVQPSALVALGRVPGLRDVAVEGGVMRIGALVTHQQVAESQLVRSRLTVLAETFQVVANHRVRAAATVGGVLAEADHASDPPAVFVALDALVVVVGPGGERRVPAAELVTGYYETSLAAGEIIRSVEVPLPPGRTHGAYCKYRSTSSEDRPCVGVAALVRLDEAGGCEDVRVCVGAASDVPLRLPGVEQAARGRPLDAEAMERIAGAYAAAIRPLADGRGSAWYRREMVSVFVVRALRRALESCARERGDIG